MKAINAHDVVWATSRVTHVDTHEAVSDAASGYDYWVVRKCLHKVVDLAISPSSQLLWPRLGRPISLRLYLCR